MRRLTEKYRLFRESFPAMPAARRRSACAVPARRYGELAFTESADLLDNLDRLTVRSRSRFPCRWKTWPGLWLHPLPGQVRGPREKLPVRFQQLHDRPISLPTASFRHPVPQ